MTAGGVVAVAHLINDSMTSMFPALLPQLATRLEIGGAAAAMLVAMFSISTSLPQPALGLVADRIGTRRAVGAGLLITAVLVTALGFVQSAEGLALLLLLGGLGSATVHPAGVALAGRIAGANRATAMGIFAAGGMIGSAIGPIAALTITAAAGVQSLVWLMIPAAVIGLAVQWAGNPSIDTSSDAQPPQRAHSLVSIEMMQLTGVGILAALPFMTLVNSLPLWLAEVHGMGESSPTIGYALATFSAAAAVGGILSGIASRHVHRALITAGSLIAAVPAVLMILNFGPGSPAFFVGLALGGASLYAHMPLLIATAQEKAPGRESAAAGMMLGMTWAAAGLLYIGIGWAQDHFSFSFGMSLAATGLLPASFLAWRAMAARPVEPVAPSEFVGVCPCPA
jgi:FSR family fosmidomycin resistance protein-like MFS transporter